MGETSGTADRRRDGLLVVELLCTLPLTWAFLMLVGRYWASRDTGINAAANGVVLLFLVAPVILVLLLVASFVAWYVSNELLHAGVLGSFSLWLLSVGGICGLAFGVVLWQSAGYPSP